MTPSQAAFDAWATHQPDRPADLRPFHELIVELAAATGRPVFPVRQVPPNTHAARKARK